MTPDKTYKLDSVELALRNFTGSTTVDVLIATSDPNTFEPGGTSSVIDVDVITAPSAAGLVTANFNGADTLQAGTTYWIWLHTPQPGDASGWMLNTSGSSRTFALSTDNGVTWSNTIATDPALRVNGTPVPEPSTLSLVCVGLAALMRRRWSSQQR